MKTLAIIPAGGLGRRMGGEVPKQFLPLAGVPVLVHTLRAFQRSPLIDEIFLVVPEREIPGVRRDIVQGHRLSKVAAIFAGGAERQDSVANALTHVREEHGIVLVHDAVRPFVTAEMIRRVVAAATEHGAAAVGLPVRDTVKRVSAAGVVEKTEDREGLWLTQTPQAFRRQVIRAAYEKAAQDGFVGTDDASLVERIGGFVRMIPGDHDNIKMTTPADLELGAIIIRRFSSEQPGGRPGQGGAATA
jgi:2-C-methyl-D-erythritol 4-phosphate cytidylyltransferase